MRNIKNQLTALDDVRVFFSEETRLSTLILRQGKNLRQQSKGRKQAEQKSISIQIVN